MIDIPNFWDDNDYFIKKENKQLKVKEDKLTYIDVEYIEIIKK